MDATQIILIITLSVTTIFLIIVGIQLFLTLKDARETIKKVNTIVESFEKVGLGIERGFHQITGFAAGLKTLFRLIDRGDSKKHEKHKRE